ncbi:MAG: bifunctional alpha,alpha-trehalose-phosphate synthase (UDP-forming)/trehalose-phosphatase [Planctomycetes bacterium]|nr:bifunctional alpha,alpha-trehalose-phosphate synthase (UDP-forming)/trehalose-phosphatase [Planctomycetota bacterium]
MSRLLIVSNRLPVTVKVEGGEISIHASVGGLATGLQGVHQRSHGSWIGWPGVHSEPDDAVRANLDQHLEPMRLAPVHLTEAEVAGFYTRFSNGVLWPLLHSMLDKIPLQSREWSTYSRVNERFAAAVAARYQPGDLVWVHDYQLMLVPEMLRRLVPEARIGFFLHIPFPSSSVFRALPQREEILRGLLGADVIGFHTASYVRNFAASLLRILGQAVDVDRLWYDRREVRIGSFPMGIDAAAFSKMADDPAVLAEARALRNMDDCAVLVGIDRLDYTKGITRRLLAFERLLSKHPELSERVHLLQVAVPSRSKVAAYKKSRARIDALIGKINGTFATPRWSPVRYLHRAMTQREVVALYRAADVMVVTPVRDGMNLVAKEFAAARSDEDGVLVLSEFAGAASEMGEALLVNPYDIAGTADALHRALSMPREERRLRMQSLRKRVATHDSTRWAGTFLDALAAAASRPHRGVGPSPAAEVTAAANLARSATHLTLLLDYDGTLVPYALVPESATPDPALLELLRGLSRRPRTEVHVVSGRSRLSLEEWFGSLRMGLHAEHGLWSRPPGFPLWKRLPLPELPSRERIAAILADFADRTPGARVEQKESVIAWHWRQADPQFGRRQACELRLHLTELLSNVGAEVVAGDHVIEVRPYGVNKGIVASSVLGNAPPGSVFVAMGDDTTDEDLFSALPADAIPVHVGPHPSSAKLRAATTEDARQFLRSLLESPSTSASTK